MMAIFFNKFQPDQISEYGDLPPRESPGDAGESPNIPEPAWYNRENIYEEEDNGMNRSRSGVGMDPSYMDEDTPGASFIFICGVALA